MSRPKHGGNLPRSSKLFAGVALLLLLTLLISCGVGSRRPRAPARPAEEPAARTPNDPIERGVASWYGRKFHGRLTANGERYDMYELTAAHPTLPFGTRLRVVNRENGRAVVVRINDRGPFVGGRVIDLSYAAAREIGMIESGLATVDIYRVD